MEQKLDQWQEECLERWFSNRGRGMVQAVTGSGKTLLALTAAKRLKETLDQKLLVKIVVPTGALMRQWNHALREFLADSEQDASVLRDRIGMRGSGIRTPSDRSYMIYVINSARYELARQILSDLKSGAAVLLIADECHRYESGQNRLIFEFLPFIKEFENSFFSLGLSATLPSGQAQKELASFLGKKIYTYGMKQASAMHSVCQYDICHIALSFQRPENEAYQELSEKMTVLYASLLHAHPPLKNMTLKERFELLRRLTQSKDKKLAQAATAYMNLSYKRKQLVCLAHNRLSCVCELLNRLPSREKILIFGERIRQAEELYGLLRTRYPEKVGRYHSQMGAQANQNALARFRDGSIRILISCKAMDEGVNIPDASIGIILSGTSVQRQRIQRLGRIIRRKEGKRRATLYYLHITDSAEDRCFLPEDSACHLTELEYDADAREFYNPRYTDAASRLLRSLSAAGAGDEILQEYARCLRLGLARTDWLLSPDEIDAQLQTAERTEDKNYWICMKKLLPLTV